MSDPDKATARAQGAVDAKQRKIDRLEARLARERLISRGTEREIADEQAILGYLAAHPLLKPVPAPIVAEPPVAQEILMAGTYP